MRVFRGQPSSLALPGAAALVCGLIAVSGVVLALLDGPLQVIGYNEKVALLIGSGFFLMCGVTALKVGLNGYYSTVTVDRNGVVAVGPLSSRRLKWSEVKRVVPLSLGASLTLTDNRELEFGPSLAEYDQLADCLRHQFEAYKKGDS